MLRFRPGCPGWAGFAFLRRTATLRPAFTGFSCFTGFTWFAWPTRLTLFPWLAAFAIVAPFPGFGSLFLFTRWTGAPRCTSGSAGPVLHLGRTDVRNLRGDGRGAAGLTCQAANDIPDLLNERKCQ
jgi:hypothetical protein